MEAIILAGGFGTRLRPLTYSRAKSLIPILNKPMITYLFDLLPKQVDKVVLAVNYRKDQIEEFFKENDFGREIIVNNEPKPLGTGGAVKFAEEHITDTFLVLNSDIICSLNIDNMIKFHKKNKAISTISLWPVENVSEFGVVDIQPSGKINRFVEKPKPDEAPSEFINAGAYCLEKSILDYIDTGHLISMEKEIFPQIIKDTGKFYGFKFDGYWMDIGRISSYIEVHKFLMLHNGLDSIQGKNNENLGFIKHSCLGDNVKVGEDSKLNSAVVLDNAVIGDNVNIINCVIGENVRIGENTELIDSVIGDNEVIKNNKKIDNKAVWTQPIPKGYPDKQIGNPIQK